MSTIKSHILLNKKLGELGDEKNYYELSQMDPGTLNETQQIKYDFIGEMTGIIDQSGLNIIYIYDGTYTYTYTSSSSSSYTYSYSYSYSGRKRYGGVGNNIQDTSYKYFMNFLRPVPSDEAHAYALSYEPEYYLQYIDFYSDNYPDKNSYIDQGFDNLNLVITADPNYKLSSLRNAQWYTNYNINISDIVNNAKATNQDGSKGIKIDKSKLIKAHGVALNNQYSYWQL